MIQKESRIALLIILSTRTVFIFSDAFIFTKQVDSQLENDNTPMIETLHNSASKSMYIAKNPGLQNEEKQFEKAITENLENGLKNTQFKINDIKKTIGNLNYDNVKLLEKIYKKDNNPDVFKLLLKKLIKDYQFDKVKKYMTDIDIFRDKNVSPYTYIYTYINSLSITNDTSITKFMSFIDQMRYKSMIGADDYTFYKGLSKLWVKDYKGADILFHQIKSPIYHDFTNQIAQAVEKFENQTGVPKYYEDSLISLVAMKNGYFSLANKLAVGSVLQDSNYILPYQILAYSNFLTNNWNKAIENFYDLIKLDIENQDKYNFYIGVSYYRGGEYKKSISILNPLLYNTKYKMDVYRYLLLNYQQLGNNTKMIQLRKKILGQDNLKESDFKTFYDIAFYKPFSTNTQNIIYNQNYQLSYDFISICYEKFGQKNNTCLYGEVGLDIINDNRQDIKNNLLYLAENYPQSQIFQALGHYYELQKMDGKAKTYYLKAVSLADNISQKSIIENELIDNI